MRLRIATTALCIALLAACEQSESSDSQGSDAPEEMIGEPAFKTRAELEVDEQEAPEIGQQDQELVGDALCKPCTSNSQCGGANNYCLRRSDGVRFCGQDCRRSACPSSYTCMRVSSTVSQCVPPQLDCSRVPREAGVPDASLPDATVPDAGPADASTPADGAVPAEAGLVPGTSLCAPVSTYSATWNGYEDEVLRLSNQYRASGASCGGISYASAPALRMSPALRCAARLHSRDMQLRNFFDHTNPDGVTFDQRITATGYLWRTAGENIAAGYRTPAAVVQGWMQSTGHCKNIMNPSFTELGVGFYDQYRWTQSFGTPR